MSPRSIIECLPIRRRPRARATIQTVMPACVTYELREQLGESRAVAETFISDCFAANYGARIAAFMPRLFTVRDAMGGVCGAFGLRAGGPAFFLEQYLDAPVEALLAARTGQSVTRRAVVEVGQFAGSFPGSVRVMIELLTERLHREGYEWVAFTGTTELRNAFARMGLAPIDIASAFPARLPEAERASWGRYYEHAPRVLIGHVESGYRLLRTRHGLPGAAA